MNYYVRHLGDYAKDTTNLTTLEHGVYNLLIDRYYSTEKGIPADQVYRVTKAASKEERSATDFVLGEFFQKRGNTWASKRCDEEIAKARHRIEQARLNGKNGGRPRNPEITHPDTGQEPTRFPSANRIESSPLSILHSPIEEKESEAKNGLSRNRKSELDRLVAETAQGRKIKEST